MRDLPITPLAQESAADKLREAFDLQEFGLAMQRQRFVREFGTEQAPRRFLEWLAGAGLDGEVPRGFRMLAVDAFLRGERRAA